MADKFIGSRAKECPFNGKEGKCCIATPLGGCLFIRECELEQENINIQSALDFQLGENERHQRTNAKHERMIIKQDEQIEKLKAEIGENNG